MKYNDLKKIVERIYTIPNYLYGGDWDEIEEARLIIQENYEPVELFYCIYDNYENGYRELWQKNKIIDSIHKDDIARFYDSDNQFDPGLVRWYNPDDELIRYYYEQDR